MNAKSQPISIRLTEEEISLLDNLAKEREISRSELLRQIVRKAVNLPTAEDILKRI